MPFMSLSGGLLRSQRAAFRMQQDWARHNSLLGSLGYGAAQGQQAFFDTRYVGKAPLFELFDKKGITLRDELQRDIDEWLKEDE
jgi:hypothetical protein